MTRTRTANECIEERSEQKPPRHTLNCCQRLTSLAYGFFARSLDQLCWSYSKLTGPIHSDIPELPGGHLAAASQAGGKGLGEIIDRATELALKTPRGMATFRIGTRRAFVILKPADIQQVLHYHARKLNDNDTTGAFAQVFGKNNIFDLPEKTKAWREKRTDMHNWLFTQKSLMKLSDPMQRILDKHIQAITRAEDNAIDLKKFCTELTMDVIMRSVLGIKNISPDMPHQLSSMVESAMEEIANPKNSLLHKFHLPVPLDTILAKGHEILRKDVLKHNEHHIRTTDNWLRMVDEKESESLSIQSDKMINEVTLFVTVGHETTAKFLQYTLMLLADHPDALHKVRAEIESHGKNPEHWTTEDIEEKKLPYLEKVLNESLRLYPPVPIMKSEVSHAFSIGYNIPQTRSHEEYKKAMSNRQTKQDVSFQCGDFIFMVPWATQRLTSFYGDDANQFRPDRFKSSKELNPFSWFPFGFGARLCVGQKFTLQEVKFIVARLVSQFDLTLHSSHPYRVEKVFSLRPAESVTMQFIRRRDQDDKSCLIYL